MELMWTMPIAKFRLRRFAEARFEHSVLHTDRPVVAISKQWGAALMSISFFACGVGKWDNGDAEHDATEMTEPHDPATDPVIEHDEDTRHDPPGDTPTDATIDPTLDTLPDPEPDLVDYRDLCEPCTDSDECGIEFDYCLTGFPDGGTYCGLACSDESDCPVGYECRHISGASSNQCVPLDMEC